MLSPCYDGQNVLTFQDSCATLNMDRAIFVNNVGKGGTGMDLGKIFKLLVALFKDATFMNMLFELVQALLPYED